MNAMIKFGIAAAVLAMAVALGYGLWQNIGNLAPDPQPSDDASGPGGDLPPELQYSFVGATRAIDGIENGDRLVLDFRNRVFALNTAAGTTEIASLPTITDEGQLRLETVVDTTACQQGDVGTYAYSFSSGETILTIQSGSDDCAPRAAAVPGEWRRSACENLDIPCLGIMGAGTQTTLQFDPFNATRPTRTARYGAMTYEVPDGWANSDDSPALYRIARAMDYDADWIGDCLDCPDEIWLAASPAAVAAGCTFSPDPDVGTSAEALADWLRAHPGLEATEGPAVTVDGRPTIVLDVAAPESNPEACEEPVDHVMHVPLFSRPGGWDIALPTGDRMRLMLVEIEPDNAMLISIDSRDPGDLETMIADTQPIIESIRLTPP